MVGFTVYKPSASYSCQNSIGFSCGSCSVMSSIVYQSNYNSNLFKSEVRCLTCTQGVPKGTLYFDYTFNSNTQISTAISGSVAFTSGNQLCSSGTVMNSAFTGFSYSSAANSYTCQNGGGFTCGTCTTFASSIIYKSNSNPNQYKNEVKCAVCTKGTSSGYLTFDYYNSGNNASVAVTGSTLLTSGNQLCSVIGSSNSNNGGSLTVNTEFAMTGYQKVGTPSTIACTDTTYGTCGNCTSLSIQDFASTANSDSRKAYTCTTCVSGRPRGVVVFQMSGSGVNTTTKVDYGQRLCKSTSITALIAVFSMLALFY